jgi:Tfp pilus assembly protein PilV
MKTRRQSGMAMVIVLGVVVLLSIVVAFAINLSGRERRETGKLIHNATIQQMTESTLQRARGFFANNYGANGSTWNTYLAYFVDNPVILTPPSGTTAATQITNAINALNSAHPELINPNTPAGYSCYMYLRDDMDEFGTANNPKQDNNHLVYVGAVCAQTAINLSQQSSPLVAELTAPLLYNPVLQYANQASGGTQGLNNSSTIPGYR